MPGKTARTIPVFRTFVLTVPGIAIAALAWAAPPAGEAQTFGTPCEKLQALNLPDVTITASEPVPAGAFAAPGVAKPIALPAFCRVQAVARPTPDSEIKFEVWLPDAWNGKFQGVGTGGFDGRISYGAMAPALRLGYAVTSTDTGHSGDDLKFGLGHPEKLIDWAWRAMHVTAEAGKLITRDAKGRWPEHSYFVGCATGGHQALSEAQRFPQDYDGIIAGDPGNDRLYETAGWFAAWLATHDQNGVSLLSQTKLQFITRAAVVACDEIDGVKDGVIDDPRRCRFDPASLLCKGSENETCLTPAQVDAVKKVYKGTYNPRTGKLIIPGWSIGSEGFGPTAAQGWGGFITEPKSPIRSELYSYFVFHDPNWDFHSFDFDKDLAYTDRKIGFLSAVDTDLSGFRARGGKLILYSGWDDPVAAGEDVVGTYEATLKLMGAEKLKSFYRFFMVPGHGPLRRWPGHHQLRHAAGARKVGGAGRRAAKGDRGACRGQCHAAYPAALSLSGSRQMDGQEQHRRRRGFCLPERKIGCLGAAKAGLPRLIMNRDRSFWHPSCCEAPGSLGFVSSWNASTGRLLQPCARKTGRSGMRSDN